MSTATARSLAGKRKARRFPRRKAALPLDLTVVRSGIPDNIPGRTLDLAEGGAGVVIAGELRPGEAVAVEFQLPYVSPPLRTRAVVRYHSLLCCGLEFVGLSAEQQSKIRNWAAERTAGESSVVLREPEVQPEAMAGHEPQSIVTSEVLPAAAGYQKRRFSVRRGLAVVISVLVIVAALGWWRWQRGWTELEAQIPAQQARMAKPLLKVPADTMEQRIIHRVEPLYPDIARQAGIEGRVILDAIVGPDGTITELQAASGPEPLARSAMDAVRWWRYEPVNVNGQPVAVETSIVVDFQLQN
jgi:TonB family protein